MRFVWRLPRGSGGDHHGFRVRVTMELGWGSPWTWGEDRQRVGVGITKGLAWGITMGFGWGSPRGWVGDHHRVWVGITIRLR